MAHSKQRVLITGASGLLGRRLVPVFAADYDVTAVVFHNSLRESGGSEVRTCDLTDYRQAEQLLLETAPAIIINCAATTDVDGCESDPAMAYRLNCGIVENLLNAVSSHDFYFVQISTDYIFGGGDGQYTEQTAPNPLNTYGRTKLQAEEAIRESGVDALIIRTCALYDCGHAGKTNLFSSTYDRLRKGEVVRVASDLYCNPIWTANLADCIREAVSLHLTGVINMAGPEYLSRYEFSSLVARQFGFTDSLVEAIELSELARAAKRPLRAGLDISLALETLSTKPLTLTEAFTLIDSELT
jgi:dTDP-4-dehydrorhamnose reductase